MARAGPASPIVVIILRTEGFDNSSLYTKKSETNPATSVIITLTRFGTDDIYPDEAKS